MLATGFAPTQLCCRPRAAASRPLQLRAQRLASVVPRAVAQGEAPQTVEGLQEQVAKLQHDLQKEQQQRDYWRDRCMEVEERYKKLKTKYDNMMAHDHPSPQVQAKKEEYHLGQKRDFLPEDDNKGRRDM